MKIVIQKREIERVLVRVIPFLESKDMSMVTSNVLIELKDEMMTISGTNYELGLKSNVHCMGIVSEGTILVNGKRILDIIKILKNDNITIEVIKNDLHITQGRSKFKVALFGDVDFPNFPTLDKNVSIDVNSNALIESFRLITPSMDTNNPKHELNSTLMDIKSDVVNFVSTDTKRLSIVSLENQNDNELSIIIPRVAITEIQKLFNEDIKIYCDNTYFVIETDFDMFFTKLVNGKYPDYNRIIPKDYIHQITVNKLQMIENLKQVNVISNEVQIDISNNQIMLSSTGDSNNKAVAYLDINFNSDDNISMVVNSKFILDFLNVVYDNGFTFGINEANMPFVLQSGDLKTIIMPVVL